jgi:hypothetical protein
MDATHIAAATGSKVATTNATINWVRSLHIVNV